jgi:hypothetical protein
LYQIASAQDGGTARSVPQDDYVHFDTTAPGQRGLWVFYDAVTDRPADPTRGGYYFIKNMGNNLWVNSIGFQGTQLTLSTARNSIFHITNAGGGAFQIDYQTQDTAWTVMENKVTVVNPYGGKPNQQYKFPRGN